MVPISEPHIISTSMDAKIISVLLVIMTRLIFIQAKNVSNVQLIPHGIQIFLHAQIVGMEKYK